MKGYVATIQVLIRAHNEDEAKEIINAVMTDKEAPNHRLWWDWAYLHLNGQLLFPTLLYPTDTPFDYEEGDFLLK